MKILRTGGYELADDVDLVAAATIATIVCCDKYIIMYPQTYRSAISTVTATAPGMVQRGLPCRLQEWAACPIIS